MANNVVVFQGVEVNLPPEVAFTHREGCLEVDMSHGFSGKLLLRRAPSHQKEAAQDAALHPLQACVQQRVEDALLVQDSLDAPPSKQAAGAAPASRAYWFNSSPRPTQDQPAAASGQARHGASPERCNYEAPAAAATVGTGAPATVEPAEAGAAPAAPEELCLEGASLALNQSSGAKQDATALHTPAAAMHDQAAASPDGEAAACQEDSPGAEKENQQMQTPATAASMAKASGGKEKRSSVGGTETGSKSVKRQKGAAGAAANAGKEFALRWRPVEAAKTGAGGAAEEAAPAARWGASFTALSDSQGCLYGGSSEDGPRGDAWLFDVQQLAWAQTATSGFGGFPGAAKAWQAAALLVGIEGRQLVVFGGEQCRGSPSHREGGAAAAEGGEDAESEPDCEPIADVCTLDPQAHFWVSVPMDGTDGCKQVPARAGATMTALPDGRGLVFGGLDEEGRYRNDAFVLDAKRLSWFSLAGIMKGAPPKPRAYHSATLVGQRIIIIGGLGSRVWSCKEVYSLQVNSWKWTEHTHEVEGDVPAPRSGHSAAALADGRHVLLFGGGDCNKDTFFSGAALLDTHTWRWSSPKIQGVARPSGRAGHAAAMLRLAGGKQVLVVQGGRTKEDRLLKDTWLLELVQT